MSGSVGLFKCNALGAFTLWSSFLLGAACPFVQTIWNPRSESQDGSGICTRHDGYVSTLVKFI
jgi:hypothetical protein